MPQAILCVVWTHKLAAQLHPSPALGQFTATSTTTPSAQ